MSHPDEPPIPDSMWDTAETEAVQEIEHLKALSDRIMVLEASMAAMKRDLHEIRTQSLALLEKLEGRIK